MCTVRMAQASKRLGLDLPNSLTAQVELLSNFPERGDAHLEY